MANIAASNVTYTIVTKRRGLDSRTCSLVTLAFGDGSLTYPAGGIPITIGKLGCPNTVESMIPTDKGTSGYSFSYDKTNAKLLVFRTGAINAVDEQLSTVAIAAQSVTFEVVGW